MSQVSRHHHYVPQGLMRRWAGADRRVWAYRVLVPRDDYPEWELRAIRGLAVVTDLYTSEDESSAADEFEDWMAREFESPGLAAIDKVCREERLAPADWDALIRLYAAQCVRTLASYTTFAELCESTIPAALNESLEALGEANLRLTVDEDRRAASGVSGGNEIARVLRSKLTTTPVEGTGQSQVRADVRVDRQLWLGQIRHLLRGVAEQLLSHRWNLRRPDDGVDWPLTDNPALRVNWYGPGNFDLKGGWGRMNGDLLMPISPQHMLHTTIGRRVSARSVSSDPEATGEFRKIILAGALRWVFAREPEASVARLRPRRVDAELFHAEQAGLREWDTNQRGTGVGREPE